MAETEAWFPDRMKPAYACKCCGIRCLAYTEDYRGFCDRCYKRVYQKPNG